MLDECSNISIYLLRQRVVTSIQAALREFAFTCQQHYCCKVHQPVSMGPLKNVVGHPLVSTNGPTHIGSDTYSRDLYLLPYLPTHGTQSLSRSNENSAATSGTSPSFMIRSTAKQKILQQLGNRLRGGSYLSNSN